MERYTVGRQSKVNPRRIPVSKADIDKAKDKAVDEALERAWSIIFTVLRDKEGYNLEGLLRVWNHVMNLSDSVVKGYVTIADLKHILKIEEGANII
jgi:hypothetical protein